MRRTWNAARVVMGGVLAAAAFAMVAYAAPAPFFGYSVEAAGMTLRSDHPFEEGASAKRLRAVAGTLEAADLGASAQGVTFYASRSAWREKLFSMTVPNAGGVVNAPLSTSLGFLVAMGPEANRLLKGDYVLTPPRTLEYYMVHEATHLLNARRLGVLEYHLLPAWVREGLADYVALGPMSPATQEVAVVRSQGGVPLEVMKAHGSYPAYRAQVTRVLARGGRDMAALLERFDQTEACQWH